MERFQEEHCPSQIYCLKVLGSDSLTPYERRALYQVEKLALGASYSLERVLSIKSSCRTGLKFQRWKGAGAGNAAQAIEHLVVFCAKELAKKAGFSGFSLFGETRMGEDNIPTITVSFFNIGRSEEILLRATNIVAAAVNNRLLVKSGPERRISFLVE